MGYGIYVCGAGWGLDDDGNPTNPNSANNHLHFVMAVPDPAPGSNDWVIVDPYGVYERVGWGCYALLGDTEFPRLSAPFYPAFDNLPTNVLANNFNYYAGMGMGLQTLSIHRKGDRVLASGSFQRGLEGSWYCRFDASTADLGYWFDE